MKTIDPTLLAHVTGGRISKGPEQIDPRLLQGIGELAKAVQAVGQGLIAERSQKSQGMLQMMSQLLQRRR